MSMKKALFLIFAVIISFSVKAQTPAGSKVFWSESFKTDNIPQGWKNVDNSKQSLEWIVTDQPYPGSYQYQQQAPPIASKSRGYYLQFQPGYMVDEDQESWFKKKSNTPIPGYKHLQLIAVIRHQLSLNFSKLFGTMPMKPGQMLP